ncbi:hypothetical protein LCGC14_2720300 [marine sediment metagenome]|uniref:Uncharacterized protein n=1 Tax=marine sediment metagenome TaxID=412755 RepID=A0A0F8ZA67_9ZZZZ
MTTVHEVQEREIISLMIEELKNAFRRNDMVTVKRIYPKNDVTFQITASPEVWRCVIVAVGSQNFVGGKVGDEGILQEFYDFLHAEIHKL